MAGGPLGLALKKAVVVVAPPSCAGGSVESCGRLVPTLKCLVIPREGYSECGQIMQLNLNPENNGVINKSTHSNFKTTN